MAEHPRYPFIPKSNAKLAPGQFWAIPLSDGRFGCGRVLAVEERSRTMFTAALLDWVGDEPPTAGTIAGAPVLEVGRAHVRAIQQAGGGILGERDLRWDRMAPPMDVRSFWGDGYATSRAEHRFVAGEPTPRSELRQVESPLTDEMLRPLEAPTGRIQFNTPLTFVEYARLADWMSHHPSVWLRVYGWTDEIGDLEFLRHFGSIKRFQVDLDRLPTLEGLRHLPDDLEALAIGASRTKLDLTPVRRFGLLRRLLIEGPVKGIEVLQELSSLEDLTLRSVTLPDLSLLLPLSELRALDIKLGGTKDLALLPDIGKIRYLELWMIRGLSDISVVGDLTNLRYLFLQSLRQVTRLPSFARCAELRGVHLETMKGISDLAPLTSAPSLEEIHIVDMPHLQPEDLACLKAIRSLQAISAGLGSLRKNEAVRHLLGLPEASWEKASWRLGGGSMSGQ